MRGTLRLVVAADRDATLVRVVGEVDLASAPDLRDCLMGLEGAVVVDLADVAFLDSSGLNALIGSKKHLEQTGGSLRLRGGPPHVRNVLEVTGLADWFEVEP